MVETKERQNLLLIENDKLIQTIFEVILDGCNWDVISRENGDAAVKEWKTRDFSGILLDLDLPYISGIEVTRLIRRIERERDLVPTPILGISKILSDAERFRYLESGMNGFITKPIRPNELCASVGSYLCQ